MGTGKRGENVVCVIARRRKTNRRPNKKSLEKNLGTVSLVHVISGEVVERRRRWAKSGEVMEW